MYGLECEALENLVCNDFNKGNTRIIYQFQSYVNTVDDRQKRRKIGGKGKRKREGQKALKNVIGVWR